jgi:hypothetical protein
VMHTGEVLRSARHRKGLEDVDGAPCRRSGRVADLTGRL